MKMGVSACMAAEGVCVFKAHPCHLRRRHSQRIAAAGWQGEGAAATRRRVGPNQITGQQARCSTAGTLGTGSRNKQQRSAAHTLMRTLSSTSSPRAGSRSSVRVTN